MIKRWGSGVRKEGKERKKRRGEGIAEITGGRLDE